MRMVNDLAASEAPEDKIPNCIAYRFVCPVEVPPQKHVPVHKQSNPYVPDLFTQRTFKPGTLNVDVGGGLSPYTTDYLASKGVTNLIWDPFARSQSYNRRTLQAVRRNFGADSVTCSFVLNYLVEPHARIALIKNCFRLLKPFSKAFFRIGIGNASGIPEYHPYRDYYQANWVAKQYAPYFDPIFPEVTYYNRQIVARKTENRLLPPMGDIIVDGRYYSL